MKAIMKLLFFICALAVISVSGPAFSKEADPEVLSIVPFSKALESAIKYLKENKILNDQEKDELYKKHLLGISKKYMSYLPEDVKKQIKGSHIVYIVSFGYFSAEPMLGGGIQVYVSGDTYQILYVKLQR